MYLLEMKGVKKHYQTGELSVEALKGIEMGIDPGKFISFIGPSGSGKTTLLNLMGCLDKPSEGQVLINGSDVTRLDRKDSAKFRGEHIGFIFQNFNLIPVLTVYENVEYPLIMVQNVPAGQREKKILDLLGKVGMLDKKDKYPEQLSGGQKQRVAIARALVTDPKIVLADEPTANLDHDTAYKIIKIMHDMKSASGTTFIFATHDTKVIGEAEVIYTMEDGVLTGRQDHNRSGGR